MVFAPHGRILSVEPFPIKANDYTTTGDLPIATSVTYAYLPSLIALEEGA